MSDRFQRGNQILELMNDSDYNRLLPKLVPVNFEVPDVLYEVNSPVELGYFPISGAISAVVVMENGDMVEAGTIGNEGAIGLPTIGPPDISANRVFVQVKGAGLKVATSELAKISAGSEHFRQLIGRCQVAFNFQITRSVACNALHQVQQRCARWLLMTHDRVELDEVGLTHELLSVMLGVRRASVTEVVQVMQEQGLIRGARGKITVLDRPGLEKLACECYSAVQREYARLLV